MIKEEKNLLRQEVLLKNLLQWNDKDWKQVIAMAQSNP